MEFKNRTHSAEEGGLNETSGPKGCSNEEILNRLAANWSTRTGHWFNRKLEQLDGFNKKFTPPDEEKGLE